MKTPEIEDVIDSYKLDVTHRELVLIRAALQGIDVSSYSLDNVNTHLFDCAEFNNLDELKDEVKSMLKLLSMLDDIYVY